LVGVLVSLAHDRQRPVPKVNRVSGLPVGNGRTQRRRHRFDPRRSLKSSAASRPARSRTPR